MPISKEDELEMQYKPSAGMQLIGTVAQDQVPRHCFMHVSRCFPCCYCLLSCDDDCHTAAACTSGCCFPTRTTSCQFIPPISAGRLDAGAQ